MSDPFIAEIRIFAGNFAIRGFAFCNGALLPIAQNTALFALVGTTFGGDGRTTLGLPNLSGRAPMHPGNGPGLSNRRLGESGGVEKVTLTDQQMAAHTHTMRGNSGPADDPTPVGESLARSVPGNVYQQDTTSNLVPLASSAMPGLGAGQPHDNMQPYLTLNFIIALQGIFPSRS